MGTTTTIKGGAVLLPAELRDRYGLADGSVLIVEAGDDGIVLRPANEPETEIEVYTPERKAEFLLTNAVTFDESRWAVEEVRRMGLDPAAILHSRPVT